MASVTCVTAMWTGPLIGVLPMAPVQTVQASAGLLEEFFLVTACEVASMPDHAVFLRCSGSGRVLRVDPAQETSSRGASSQISIASPKRRISAPRRARRGAPTSALEPVVATRVPERAAAAAARRGRGDAEPRAPGAILVIVYGMLHKLLCNTCARTVGPRVVLGLAAKR
jgi:hypothetical protein